MFSLFALAVDMCISWTDVMRDGEQSGLGRDVLHAVDRTKAAFVKKLQAEIDKEIDAFYLHLDDVLSYQKKLSEFEARVKQVDHSRKKYVEGEVQKF
ncbi:hypothetical protein M758_UG245200 [Ceratodon purpureus]|nr:hypothetical protein M758_UG245200 [Ceratodon purpureus]